MFDVVEHKNTTFLLKKKILQRLNIWNNKINKQINILLVSNQFFWVSTFINISRYWVNTKL